MKNDLSPTTFAAKLILEGHSPDEVKSIMESRKMSYPAVSNVLDEFMSKKISHLMHLLICPALIQRAFTES